MTLSSLNRHFDAEKAWRLHVNPINFDLHLFPPRPGGQECARNLKAGMASKKLGFAGVLKLCGYFLSNRRHETGANDCGAEKARNRNPEAQP